jgi:hypothetical protein
VRAGDDRFKNHRFVPESMPRKRPRTLANGTSLMVYASCHFYVAFFAFSRICSSRLSVGDRQSPSSMDRRLGVALFSHQFIIF